MVIFSKLISCILLLDILTRIFSTNNIMPKVKKDKLRETSSKFERTKSALIQTRNAIRKKFRELHNSKLALTESVNEVYKPIIDPLKSLVTEHKNKNKKGHDDQLNTIKKEVKLEWRPFNSVYRGGRPTRFSDLHNVSGVSPLDEGDEDESFQSIEEGGRDNLGVDNLRARAISQSSLDGLYGLRPTTTALILGRDDVKVKNDGTKRVFSVKGKKFDATPGLTDLLLNSEPKNYRQSDLNNYKEMLDLTSAHKTNFLPEGQIHRNERSSKYQNIIKYLFPAEEEEKEKEKVGSGVMKKLQSVYKTVNKNGKFNYTYWDDPNELIDRLRLLVSSQQAGHTGHNNEIISIIEELREAKIIK